MVDEVIVSERTEQMSNVKADTTAISENNKLIVS